MSISLPEFVTHWAKMLGADLGSVEALKGGMNSRVYACRAEHKRFVLKGYLPMQLGARDRFAAESEFLTYCNQMAPRFVPTLLWVDRAHRCIVMDYLEGETYKEGSTPNQQELQAAAEFFGLINQDLDTAKACVTMDAAEGYIRLTEHLHNIQNRLSEMSVNHLPRQLHPLAKRAITLLQREFDKVAEDTRAALAHGVVADAMVENQRRVSPSDFGFHNALITKDGVKFFDFEFAGWDDPAKALVDFMLQPKVPVKAETNPLLRALDNDLVNSLSLRMELLQPILHVKWCSIIVGFLHPARLRNLGVFLTDINKDEYYFSKLRVVINLLEKRASLGVS